MRPCVQGGTVFSPRCGESPLDAAAARVVHVCCFEAAAGNRLSVCMRVVALLGPDQRAACDDAEMSRNRGIVLGVVTRI